MDILNRQWRKKFKAEINDLSEYFEYYDWVIVQEEKFAEESRFLKLEEIEAARLKFWKDSEECAEDVRKLYSHGSGNTIGRDKDGFVVQQTLTANDCQLIRQGIFRRNIAHNIRQGKRIEEAI